MGLNLIQYLKISTGLGMGEGRQLREEDGGERREGCFAPAVRVTLAGGTTFLHINISTRLWRRNGRHIYLNFKF